MLPDRDRGPARHRPSTINPHPAATPGECGVNGSEFVVRWRWRLDDAANRLTVVTGRWAAAAINWELRRQRRGDR
jgi:hypothetical protein